MKPQKILLTVLFSIAIIVVLCSLEMPTELTYKSFDGFSFGHKGEITKPTSMVMYENLEKYSDEYEIPKHIIYNIAYLETRYGGPFDWKYNPAKTSCVGAVGPMQVMPSTANLIRKEDVSVNKLKTNVEFNIETSVKLLKRLYQKYGNWEIVCGCYNTGRPIVNGYAKFCNSNKNYQKNWVYLK
jgi:soluble lytic murein transglycosylase-like protein